MHLTEFVEVNIGSLDNFDFSDLNVLDWVNRGDFLGDLLLNDLTGEQVQHLSSVGLSDLFGDDVVDSFADDLLLGGQSIVGFAFLVGRLTGEGNHKDSKDVSVLRFNIRNSLNESFSLLDQGAKLVTGSVNTIETGDGLSALGLIDNKFDFAPVEAVLIGGEVSLHLTDNSAFNAVFDFF